MTVAISIPVLNEEKTLDKNIRTIKKYIDDNIQKYDVIICIADNGSTDKTEAIARQLESDFSKKIIYYRVPERGVGRALKYVWPQVEADIVGYMDLDMATDLKHLSQAIDAIGKLNYDIVYGSRLHKNSQVIGRSIKREITSRCFNLLVRFYLHVHLSDGMCGFKFLKKEILADLMAKGADNNGWFFSTELLVISEWSHYKIYELPITWTDDPESKVNIRKLTVEYLKGMRKLKLNEQAIKNNHKN